MSARKPPANRRPTKAPPFVVIDRTPVHVAVLECTCGCGGRAPQLQLPGGKSLGVNPHRPGGKRRAGPALTLESLQALVTNGAELIRLTQEAVVTIRRLKAAKR